LLSVVSCVVDQHDISMVFVAALVCIIGSVVTMRLFSRARAADGLPRAGWLFMDAVAAGSSIWATHFVSMLAYDPGVPMTFDPVLTMASLFASIVGTFGGLMVAVRSFRFAAEVGGGLVGAAVAAMHYLGMGAYRVDGLIRYEAGYVAASICLAVLLSVLAFNRTVRSRSMWRRYGAVAVFTLAIVSLHFTGMTAVSVIPMRLGIEAQGSSFAMSLAVAGVSLLVVGVAFSGYAIDSRSRDESEARLRRLADATAEGLAVVHAGRIIAVNKPFELLASEDAEALVGRSIDALFPSTLSRALTDTIETEFLCADGARLPVELSVRDSIMGPGTLVYAVRDIRARIAQEERIRHLAHHDALTDLPNRVSFAERLEAEIHSLEPGERLALLAIDLDGFKEINDLRGHSAGDEVLKVLAKAMSSALASDEFMARIGGDEFSALKRFRSDSEVLDFAERVRTALLHPVVHEEVELKTGGSIGIALYPLDAATTVDLFGKSDLAMYRAKATVGESVIAFYREDMDEGVRRNRQLVRDLKEALTRDELELRFQVQTRVRTSDITGYEVLLRWRHPTRGYVSPTEFIPIAEETGLILPIGHWVLRAGCQAAARWDVPHRIAINLSAIQLAHQDLPRLVHEILIETGLSADRLELEITETTFITDPQKTLDTLRRLKALGVSIAMDDFGTGYSSLSTLRAFPFDKIKLDRSFMGELDTSPQARAIVRAVLALGQSLNVPVLAEGVETDDQLAFLEAEGCDEAQGYLFGRPVPLAEDGRSHPMLIACA
jgi:diguanylate cyclase